MKNMNQNNSKKNDLFKGILPTVNTIEEPTKPITIETRSMVERKYPTFQSATRSDSVDNLPHENKRTPFNTFEKGEIQKHFIETMVARIDNHVASCEMQGKKSSIISDTNRFMRALRTEFDVFYAGLEEIFKVSRFNKFEDLIESLDCALDTKNQKFTRKLTEFVLTVGYKYRNDEPYLWFGLQFFANRKNTYFFLDNIKDSMKKGRDESNKVKSILEGTVNTQSSQIIKTLQALGLTIEDHSVNANNSLHLKNEATLAFVKNVISC